MAENIVILGSTGSIGTQTLEVVRAYSDRLKVVGLAANKSVDKIEAQIREFHPSYVVMYDEKAASDLKERVKDTGVKVMSGMDGLTEISSMDGFDTLGPRFSELSCLDVILPL